MYNALQNIGKAIILLILMLSAYTMASIAFPYIVPPFPTDIDFLANKQWVLDKKHWMVAFYIHITCSVIVLAAGITQFSKTLMYKYPKVHRTLGKTYVFLVLFLSAPSGLMMAFYGSGGAAAQWAFVLQALGWWFLTYMAYSSIRKGNLRQHGEYMLRSYAMTFSAITLRAATYLVAMLKFSYDIRCPNEDWFLICYPSFYVLEAWLSWVVNLLLAELLIMGGIMNYYLRKPRVE